MLNVEKEIKDVIGFMKTLGKPGADGKYMYVVIVVAMGVGRSVVEWFWCRLTFGDYFKSDEVQNTLENPFATLKAAKKVRTGVERRSEDAMSLY